MVGQGPKSRTTILHSDDIIPEIGRGFLKIVLSMDANDALKLLASNRIIHNGCECPKCFVPMTLVKCVDRSDSIKWRCPLCKSREKSIRHGSLFSKSKLPIEKLLQIVYAWSTNWANNSFLVDELEVSEASAVEWLDKCREECKRYVDQMPKLGGEVIIIEMDQMCVTKQKRHRGAPNATGNMWFQTFVERDEGGCCSARLMAERDIPTIDALVMSHVKEKTTLVSDEWPAHKNLKKRLAETYKFELGEHYMVKHKETFCKKIRLEDGSGFDIHTNKEEGLHAHMKRKMKNIMGTSLDHVEGYIAESIFRLNCSAKKQAVFNSFLDLISI